MDLMDYADWDDLWTQLEDEKTLMIFVLATYGEGEPTDNAHDFYDWLMQCSDSLSSVTYAVFGLGNTTYEHYNVMARKCDTQLLKLDATQLCARGEGDDDAGTMEDSFMTWSDEMLWPSVCKHFGMDPHNLSLDIVRSYSFKLLLNIDSRRTFHGEFGALNAWGGSQNRVTFDQKNPYYATIHAYKYLYVPGLMETDLPRQCLHIELDLGPEGTSVRYQTGDHVAIMPANDDDEVWKLAQALHISDQLDSGIFEMRALESGTKKFPFPSPCTYRAALTYYLDIQSLPKMHILNALARFAQDEGERQHLKDLSSRKHRDMYHSYIVESGRTLREVLEEHPSILMTTDEYPSVSPGDSTPSLTVGDLFELLPRLQPRYYSISSSPRLHPRLIHVTATIGRYRTKLGRVGGGVCTTYLDKLCRTDYAHREIGSVKTSTQSPRRVGIFVRTSTFRLPRNPLANVLMIGPGTGLAPFRGFMQERSWNYHSKWSSLVSKQPDKIEESLADTHIEDQPGSIIISRSQVPGIAYESNTPKTVQGQTTLVFGCRSREHDSLYANELCAYMNSDATKVFKINGQETLKDIFQEAGITTIACAFSRETGSKVYVQTLLQSNATLRRMLYDHITSKIGHVYVCGDAKNMARDVHQLMVQVVMSENKCTDVEAAVVLKTMKDAGRYQEDVWS